ncbi:MAG: HAMP domain-containing histidine kinase [Thermotogae bacterium]|nr:HAMP domain-containing histidine kinase [Thermotogota bacterium]
MEEEIKEILKIDVNDLTNTIALVDRFGNVLDCNKNFIETFGKVSNIFNILNPNFSEIVSSALSDEYPLVLIEKSHRKYFTKTEKLFLAKLKSLKKKHGVFLLELIDRSVEMMKDLSYKRRHKKSIEFLRLIGKVSEELQKEVLKLQENRVFDHSRTFANFLKRVSNILMENGIIDKFRIFIEDKSETDTLCTSSDDKGICFRIDEIVLKYHMIDKCREYFLIVERIISLAKIIKRFLDDSRNNKSVISVNTSRFELIGKILVGFFHEINNPLSSAILNTQLLFDELSSKHEVNEFQIELTRDILQSLDKMKRINEIFRGFVIDDSKDFKDVDLIAVIKNAIDNLKSEMYGICSVNFVPDNWNPHIIKGNFSKLVLMFMNLIKNSFEAIIRADREKGLIEIEILDVENEFWVSIEDNGIGMTERELKKVFDPFFTTKSETGLGYGMMIVSDVCKEHNINVEISSKKNLGTQIVLKIPKGADGNENRPTDNR